MISKETITSLLPRLKACISATACGRRMSIFLPRRLAEISGYTRIILNKAKPK